MIQSVNERNQERLANIRDYPEYYEPCRDTLAEIGHKSLLMVVGPCAVGKSYAIDTLTAEDDRFGKVRSISTRDPRPDDTPETMQTIAWNNDEIGELCTLIEQGDFVNYTFHPKTGDLYGTLRDSYPAEINVLPTLTGSVDDLTKLPFRYTCVAGLVTTPEAWQTWFESRTFPTPADRAARIAEAVISLEWLLSHADASIVVNAPGDPHYAAHQLQHITAERSVVRDVETTTALLQHVRSL